MKRIILENKQKKSTKKHLILIYTIIPFLAFFSYLYINARISPIKLVKMVFHIPPRVKYESFKVSFSSDIPESVQSKIIESVDDIEFENTKRFIFSSKGKYVIESDEELVDSFFSRRYVFVGHPYWIKESITLDEIKKSKRVFIQNDDSELDRVLISGILGSDVEVVEKDDLISFLKESEESVGIVPLEYLSSELKLLSLNGKYFFENEEGGLSVGFKLKGKEKREFVENILKRNMEIMYGEQLSGDSKSVLKINMSGVVAMSRGLASKMDSLKNYSYPAKYIGKFLGDADFTHVSNEASFVPGCAVYSGVRFCSRPEYIETLKASGVNIVELTGNHNNDFGSQRNKESIEIYKSLGWDYFGGGLNSEDASKILYKEKKGSTVAFVGYNYYDTMLKTMALAGENRAGANSYSISKLERDVSEAKKNADVVIVTFQFQECYSYPPTDVIFPICYKPLANPDQKGVFRKAVDFGADIVIGTQAHQPQTYEIYGEGIIFYGLGNLYFDQVKWIGTRQGLILSIYIENGKLIQTKLTPILLGSDLIPRIAQESDSKLLLNLLKSARDF